MPSFADYVSERSAADPSYLAKLEQAKAELRLGIGISEARQRCDWSQRVFATEAALPQSNIARYGQAANAPSMPTLWKLADALQA